MSQRETVQEYLDRGGKITYLSPTPAPQTVGAGFFSEESPAEPDRIYGCDANGYAPNLAHRTD